MQLNAHETRAVDLRKLRDAQQPDCKNNKIPAAAADGSVTWVRLDNVPVMGRLMVIHRKQGMASNYDCCICNCPVTYVPAADFLSPGSISLLVQGSVGLTLYGSFNNCNYTYFYYNVNQWATWSSQHPNIASVNYLGIVTGQSGGTSLVTGIYTGNLYMSAAGMPVAVCIGSAVTDGPSEPAPVTPNITGISPSRGLIGASTGVTISGTGFGATQGTSTVSAGSNITFSYSSWSDTQIQVTFQVGSNAPSGNHSVTVTTSEGISNSVNFYVQVPTSLSIVSGTDHTASEATCPITGNGQAATGCGVTRSFTYQVNDQESTPQPITGSGIRSLQFWDAIQTTSPNNLGLTGYTTTCTGTQAGTNKGPCNIYLSSSGQFNDSLSSCSTVCISNNACVAAGPTNASQTWQIGSFSIVQQLSYYCGKVLVNGK